jgi:cellobiose phosphorylase
LLFLTYVVAHYIRVTGDASILDENAGFLKAPVLTEEEHEKYFVPERSLEQATIFEHCRRAIKQGSTSGPHVLPLIGGGEWNEGMNKVGEEGKGESVWLAWFLIDVLNQFAELCEQRGEKQAADEYRASAHKYAEAVEAGAWDGEWYRRAYYDNGAPLGSHLSDEAKIDSLPQSWGVISGAAQPERAQQALQSVLKNLVKVDEKMILLFTPAFDKTPQNPGYIKGYLPGVRENGGQYTHGALWTALAFAKLGDGDKAVQLLQLLNPVEHARDTDQAELYKVEPYVVCADVYALEGQVGRGGWTWYTGSSGWMYRVWIEEVLGFQLRSDRLLIDPAIPKSWSEFTLRYRHRGTQYHIRVENPGGVNSGIKWVEIDGERQEQDWIPLKENGGECFVIVHLGERVSTEAVAEPLPELPSGEKLMPHDGAPVNGKPRAADDGAVADTADLTASDD